MAWRTRAAVAAFGATAVAAVGLVPAFAADPVDVIDGDLTTVTVLNINDFHGRLDGLVGTGFACTVMKEQAAAGEYAFLAAGDNIGATPFVSSSQQDNPTIDFLNALGLQATAVGNHEFDRTFADLTGRVMPRADFTHLGANVYERGTSNPALPEYHLETVNGISVGIIGVVTQETPSLVIPSGVSMLDFGDPVAAVNRVAAQLSDGDDSNGEADVIIAQYHEGATEGAATSTLEAQVALGGAFARIVNDTSEHVDAIFTGHTHLPYTWDGPITDGTRPVVQTGSYGANIGKVELGIDEDGNVVEYTRTLVDTRAPAPDPALTEAENQAILNDWLGSCLDDGSPYLEAQAIADAATALAAVIGAEEVGEITDDITTAFVGEVRDDRMRESTLGNLTANAWLWAMNQEGRPGADIGIMNPGGLRSDLFYGDDGTVTLADVAEVHPFANTMQVVDITGEQVVTLLEQQWQPEGSARPFLKLGLSDNVRYTFDPDGADGERVTGVWVDGEPIDPAATFTMASGVFLIDGGDNFTILREGTNKRDTGMIDTDAFIDYFAENSPVAPSFEKNGVAVSDTALPIEADAGEQISFTVSGVDLTSAGSPDNTSFTIFLGDEEVGSADIETVHIEGVPSRDGQSNVTFTVPADFPGGETVITLVAEPSGTVVKLAASITAVDGPDEPGPIVETDVIGSGFGSAGPLLALTLLLAAAAGVLFSRRKQVSEH